MLQIVLTMILLPFQASATSCEVQIRVGKGGKRMMSLEMRGPGLREFYDKLPQKEGASDGLIYKNRQGTNYGCGKSKKVEGQYSCQTDLIFGGGGENSKQAQETKRREI